MEITIKNLQGKIALNLRQIKILVRKILRYEGLKREVSINVIFVSHQKIRALNRRYLQKDYATDVLAFDLSDIQPLRYQSSNTGSKFLDNKGFDMVPKFNNCLIADIFISVDAAISNMKKYNTSIGQELLLYIIHGILHLLGYDDKDSLSVKKMRDREHELLTMFRGMDKKILAL